MKVEVKDKITSVLVMKPVSPTVEQLVAFLKTSSAIEILEADAPIDLMQAINQVQPAIVLLSVFDNSHVVATVNALKGMHSLAKRGRVKTMVISKIKHAQLRGIAQKLNVAEFVEEPIIAKTLQFKMNLQIKAVDAIKKRDAELKAQQELVAIKQGDIAEGKNKFEAYSADAKMRAASNLDEDAFTFRGAKVKKSGAQINFDLGGPDPASGEWRQHKPTPEGKPSWRWVPKDEKELEKIGGEKGADGWIAEGEKPEFDKLKKKWAFAGEKPKLSFNRNGKAEAVKAEVNAAGELEVAEDSPQAEARVRKALEEIAKQAEKKRAEEIEAKKAKVDAISEANAGQKAKNEQAAKEKDVDRLAALRKRSENSDQEATNPENATGTATETQKNSKRKKSSENSDPEVLEGNAGNKLERTVESEKAKRSLADLKAGLEADEDSDSEEIEAIEKNAKGSGLKPGLKIIDTKTPENKKRDLRDIADANKKDDADSGESAEADDLGRPKKEKNNKEVQENLSAKVEKNSKSAKSETAEDKLAALRGKLDKAKNGAEAPADQKNSKNKARSAEAELTERKNKLEASTKELKKEKSALRKQIEAELNEPPKAKLTPEERAQIEEEIGEPNSKRSDEELAKLAKMGRLKQLKKKLAKNDSDLKVAENEQEEIKHQLANAEKIASDKKNSDSQKSGLTEAEKARWTAKDSENEDAAPDWQGHKAKSANANNSVKQIDEQKNFHFLAANQLGVQEPAWERAKPFFVCIAAQIRYRGFDSLVGILPIWIYGGDAKPEFIEKEQRWRFLDVPPRKINDISELPDPVRNYLNEIRENAGKKSESVADSEEAAAKTETKEKKQKLLAEKKSRLEQLKQQVSEADQRSPEEAAEEGESLAELRRKKEEKVKQEMEALAAEMAEIEREAEEREEKSNRAIQEIQEARVEAENQAIRSEKNESLARKKRAEAENEATEEAKARANAEAQEAQEKRADLAAQDKAEKLESLRDKVEDTSKNKRAVPTVTDAVSAKVENAEALSFLEKRKQRKQEEAERGIENGKNGRGHQVFEEAQAKAKAEIKKTRESTLLEEISVSLLISDALYEGKNLLHKPASLLQTIKDRFGHVDVTILEYVYERKGKLIATTNPELGKTEIQELPEKEDPALIYERVMDQAADRPLGFLRLGIVSPRENFDSNDQRILRSIAVVLGDYWAAQLLVEKQRGAA